ncbi:Protein STRICTOSIDINE SYNTHASE-LIKE 10 [Raphanus sativus]|nr:Protein STRICTOSIDINE SYNTHASE-LIKE 10 [Raphanus sativus]
MSVSDSQVLKWCGESLGWTDFAYTSANMQFLAAVLNVDKTGGLIKYDRSSKKVTVLLQGIAFANGVALSKDWSFVLLAETTTCKILRLWLSGPNAGTQNMFAQLPGFPDNIRRNSNGDFWVALHSKKGLFVKLSLTQTWFRDLVLRIPVSGEHLHSLLTGGRPHATA